MNSFLKHVNASGKLLLFLLRPHLLFGWLAGLLEFIADTLRLTRWTARQPTSNLLNDFPSLKRNYNKRYELYNNIATIHRLNDDAITYMEFGVSEGHSIKWWINALDHPGTCFYGFDTFKGLPENWGRIYRKGDMAAAIPHIADKRAGFITGLFQETLSPFLKTNPECLKRRLVMHLDADLFTSTIYVLGTMAPFLKKGDIIIFDEFCVPGHEFKAYRIFNSAFRIKTIMAAAVNNYMQVAFIVD